MGIHAVFHGKSPRAHTGEGRFEKFSDGQFEQRSPVFDLQSLGGDIDRLSCSGFCCSRLGRSRKVYNLLSAVRPDQIVDAGGGVVLLRGGHQMPLLQRVQEQIHPADPVQARRRVDKHIEQQQAYHSGADQAGALRPPAPGQQPRRWQQQTEEHDTHIRSPGCRSDEGHPVDGDEHAPDQLGAPHRLPGKRNGPVRPVHELDHVGQQIGQEGIGQTHIIENAQIGPVAPRQAVEHCAVHINQRAGKGREAGGLQDGEKGPSAASRRRVNPGKEGGQGESGKLREITDEAGAEAEPREAHGEANPIERQNRPQKQQAPRRQEPLLQDAQQRQAAAGSQQQGAQDESALLDEIVLKGQPQVEKHQVQRGGQDEAEGEQRLSGRLETPLLQGRQPPFPHDGPPILSLSNLPVKSVLATSLSGNLTGLPVAADW